MGTARTPWHVDFALFLKQIAPPGTEVTLTTDPAGGDLLRLLRHEGCPRRDAEAKALHGLWPLLRADTLLDFKSVALPLERGDLARLHGHAAHYFAAQINRPLALRDLSLVLVVPTRTPTLAGELARMEWTTSSLGNGYDRIDGSGYLLYLAVIAEIADAETDGMLGLFCGRQSTPEHRRWWRNRPAALATTDLEDMPGTDEMLQQMLDSLPLEQRLAGLTLEERLAGLTPEQQLLALSSAAKRKGPS
jgi:hypothetical protein